MPQTPDPLKPLLNPPAWDMLNALPPYEQGRAAALNVEMRNAGWSADVVVAALTQARLRLRARSKFGSFADRMLFTEHGLQQSTRLPVAAQHARRFRDAGVQRVADLGCGLGGDAMAMASAGLRVVAVEADETTAAAATINLRPFPEAEVLHSTAEDFTATYGLLREATDESDTTDEDPKQTRSAGWGLWLDPARRDERSRIWDPEEFSPPLSLVTALAATGVPMGVKLGPGMPHHLIPEDCEAQWVSIDGELVELVLWFNALARRDAEGRLVRRSATVLRSVDSEETTPEPRELQVSASELSSTDDFGTGVQLDPVGSAGIRGILLEPDPAIIRAGLVAELCESLGGRLLDEHIAYFTLDDDSSALAPMATNPLAITPLAKVYLVLEVMDFSAKRLKSWAQQAQLSSVEIKKRGVDVVPEALRKQILPKKTRGSKRHAVLVITRLGTERVAAVVEPL